MMTLTRGHSFPRAALHECGTKHSRINTHALRLIILGIQRDHHLARGSPRLKHPDGARQFVKRKHLANLRRGQPEIRQPSQQLPELHDLIKHPDQVKSHDGLVIAR